MELQQTKLEQLLHKMVGDMGAAVNGALVMIGERLGLYRTLAKEGPLTVSELANRTAASERYLREWLSAQAAIGYVTYDATSERFQLTPEQTAVFADPNSPVLMTGGFESVAAVYHDVDPLADAFRSGAGRAWGDNCNCLFCGVERFFRPNYAGNLVDAWLPALNGITDKLKQGAMVADVGCGHGASTILMAQAFPNSQFTGYDFHAPSIETARQRAIEQGIRNVNFEVATAKDYQGRDFDLVAFFDCLHDMGDPVGVLRHTKQALASDGKIMLVEPMAADTLAENLNPVGAVYYGFSTAICVPTSLAQENGLALGAQAGEKQLRKVAQEAGFTHIRRAAETPFNMILEVAA